MIVCACSQVLPRKRSLKGSNLRGKALYRRAQAQLQRLPRKRGLFSSEMLSLDLAKGEAGPRSPADFPTLKQRNAVMRFATLAAVMLALIPASAMGSTSAEAKGCLKGAV